MNATANKIQSTTNYSRFKFMEGNRPVNGRVNKMIRAVKAKNQLSHYPILCTRQNGDGLLYIADGQHRFSAARALNLPVFWIEAKGVTIEDVAKANGVQAKWTPGDFIGSFASLGNPHYIALQSFIEEFKLPVTTSAALLSGALWSNGSASNLNLQSGEFVVKDDAFARRVAHAVTSLHAHACYKDRGFVLAIGRLMRVKQFNFARFVQKLEHQQSKLTKCATWAQYVDLIEDIYNWKTRGEDMVPLAIEVKKALTR